MIIIRLGRMIVFGVNRVLFCQDISHVLTIYINWTRISIAHVPGSYLPTQSGIHQSQIGSDIVNHDDPKVLPPVRDEIL